MRRARYWPTYERKCLGGRFSEFPAEGEVDDEVDWGVGDEGGVVEAGAAEEPHRRHVRLPAPDQVAGHHHQQQTCKGCLKMSATMCTTDAFFRAFVHTVWLREVFKKITILILTFVEMLGWWSGETFVKCYHQTLARLQNIDLKRWLGFIDGTSLPTLV